jgi:hypothetical protein
MNEKEKQELFAQELESSVALLSKTWDIAIIRNNRNEVVELKDFVSAIIEKSREVSKNLIESHVAQDSFYKAKDNRKATIEGNKPEGLRVPHYYDGIFEAIDRFKPVMDFVNKEFSGFEQNLPLDFSKYLQLYDADYDVAFDFSQKKWQRELEEFKGMDLGIYSDFSLASCNSPFNIVNEIERGNKPDKTFVFNIFRHIMCIQQEVNTKDIENEIQMIDTKAPFSNELMVLDSPWAILAAENTDRKRTGPEQLTPELLGLMTDHEKQKQTKEKTAQAHQPTQESAEEKKKKADALIKKIYGTPQP